MQNVITDEDIHPLSDIPNHKTHDAIFSITSKSDKAFMDLTGRFPHCSSRGNEYILVAYHYDSNAIIGLPLKNRQSDTITAAWQTLHNKLTSAGVQPNTRILDNEASQDLKHAMTKSKTSYQLVPPHTHRANAAERAIQTFKAHFTAGLASLDPDFPVNEWDRLLEQAFITLNLLRTSRVNNKLSAYTYLNGNYNFSNTPLAPPGTKAIVHIHPDTRPSWGSRGREGWYIGPSLQHYRCVKCFIPSTRAEVDSNTVTFIPKAVNFPEVTIVDFLKQAATDIITLLKHPPNPMIPSLQAGSNLHNAIYILASLLNNTNNAESLLHQSYINDKLQTQKQPLPLPFPTAPLPRVPAPLPYPHYPSPRVPTFVSPFQSPKSPTSPYHPPQINHIYDISGKRQSLEKLLSGSEKDIWQQSASG